jgi:GTP-binding protein
MIRYQQAYFLLSVAKLDQLPPDQGAEVAFVGRSNAGKSSILNRLTQQKNLARVSNTPGRTQLINFFILDEQRRLVDLPGYGYAKVPVSVKHAWEKLIDQYLQKRHSLNGLVLVMDIRHPMQPVDEQVLAWANQCQLPVHILLNKSDKLTHHQIKQTLQSLKKSLQAYPLTSLQSFSATKCCGIDELRDTLDKWYNIIGA